MQAYPYTPYQLSDSDKRAQEKRIADLKEELAAIDKPTPTLPLAKMTVDDLKQKMSRGKPNDRGGYDPVGPSQTSIYRKVDLITLPPGIEGTNCGNCQYFDDGFCRNQEVRQHVTPRECCALWSRTDVVRPWKKD